MVGSLKEIDGTYRATTTDCSLFLFINEEDRCRGLFDQVTVKGIEEVVIFKTVANDSGNVASARQALGGRVIDVSDRDEIGLVSEVLKHINGQSELMIDISALNKPELLMLMNALDNRDYLSQTRLVYSEPNDYISNENKTPSKGIQNIDSIPGFVNSTPLNRKVLLILLLGLEPARSVSIYNNYDPDDAYLIVPYPPYKEEWKGRTRRKNSHLINIVGEEKVENIHSRDPKQFVSGFESFLESHELKLRDWNTFISPLSTKPQTVGLFSLWKEYKRNFSIIQSSPLKQNKLFVPKGISSTWELLTYKDEI